MNNTLGKIIKVTLFGESHGKCVGATLDGIPAGIKVNDADIVSALDARRPAGAHSTARRESDRYEIMSGVTHGVTNGAPLCIIIPNGDIKSSDYGDFLTAIRPGHADYTSHVRNRGFEDFRGGGHFSGRLTAALVAVGAVVTAALEAKGIKIGTHVLSIGDVEDRKFETEDDIDRVKNNPFPVLSPDVQDRMKDVIEAARSDGDSVGGTLESAVTGLCPGVGEPWFETVEGAIAYAAFSIPAVKGIEFGGGFALSNLRGSDANDEFAKAQDGSITTVTNNCGGVLGGMTNGAPVVFRCAVKPTPTISKEQNTVDVSTGDVTVLRSRGRHDPCIVHRAASVMTAVTSFVVADLLAARFGADWLAQ